MTRALGPLRLALAGALLALLTAPAASAGGHRIGYGFHHWRAIDDISDGDIRDSGSSHVFSYQYLTAAVLRLEADLEYFADGYGGSGEKAYSPQFYVLFGRFLYGGIGVGITNSDGFPDGKSWSDPWYALRGGFEILLLPKIHLDLNANYRANAFSALENADTDSLTFGASLRLSLN